MNPATAVGQTTHALLQVGRRRLLEVLVLQASPLLGAAFGAAGSAIDLGRLATLSVASLLLTAHVFTFNDWAGQRSDMNDRRRAPHVFLHHGIRSGAVAGLACALLATAMVPLAALGSRATLIGAAIACLGILYSLPGGGAKGVPILASLIHLLGGTLHFLLGYILDRPPDARGLAIGVFFGLVFAAGHLNQEVRDHEADSRNGIRTTAVVFGARRALLASLAVFSAAYAELALLALLAVVPRQLVWTTLLWPLQVTWSLRALRGGPGFDQARGLQRRYRLLFAVIGLLMALSLAATAVADIAAPPCN